MTSKRDVQLVRLACKWRWMTAEQGEACLALERKLGGRRTMEEIIRRKGELDDEAIASLVKAADQAGARRRPLFGRAESTPTAAAAPSRPVVLPRSEQTVVRAVDFLATAAAAPPPRPSRRPRPSADVPSGLPRDARRRGPARPAVEPEPRDATRIEAPPTAWDRGLGAAVPQVDEDPESSARIEEPALPGAGFMGATGGPEPEVTRFEPLPWFQRDGELRPEPELPAAARPGPSIPRDETHFDAPSDASAPPSGFAAPPESAERTIMAELPAELLARLRGPDPGEDEPPTGDLPMPEVLVQAPMGTLSEATAPEPPPEPPGTLFDLSSGPEDDASGRATLLEAEIPDLPPRRPVSRSGGVSVVPYEPPVVTEEASPAPLRQVSVVPYVPPAPDAPPQLPAGVAPLSLEVPEPDEDASMSLLDEAGLAEALVGPFGPYELERVAARGRQSVVYLGKDVESGGRVAVKVLARAPADNQAFISARGGALIAAATVRSPYVVRILDVGRVDERHYVALEYVDGWTLADKLDFEDAPSPSRAFAWAGQVAAGLAAAWAAGVPHSDVRPERVLVDPTSRARLTGFGFSALSPRAVDPHMPPEGRSDSAAADAYGLGCVLQAALTGGDAEAPLPESLPGSARALLASLLDADPASRPVDFSSLSSTLTEYAEQLEREVPAVQEASERPEVRGLLVQAAAVAGVLLALSVCGVLAVSIVGLAPAALSKAILHTALAGAVGLGVATLLFATLDLIRRGELPLPMSTQWLVQVGEGAGALGALLVVVPLVLGPPAVMNVVVALLGVGLAFSAVLGVTLRRAVAKSRPDGGVGRMLAVLSDPWMTRWRTWHGPALTTLALLATARFALLAYFAAS